MSSFQGRDDTKLDRFLTKNQYSKRKLLYFVNWCSGELSKIEHHFRILGVLKIEVVKNDRNKKCATKKIFFNENLHHFWHWKLTLKVRFLNLSTTRQFTKYNNFLLEYWFLAKILSNVVTLPWKLYNLYYHTHRLEVLE